MEEKEDEHRIIVQTCVCGDARATLSHGGRVTLHDPVHGEVRMDGMRGPISLSYAADSAYKYDLWVSPHTCVTVGHDLRRSRVGGGARRGARRSRPPRAEPPDSANFRSRLASNPESGGGNGAHPVFAGDGDDDAFDWSTGRSRAVDHDTEIEVTPLREGDDDDDDVEVEVVDGIPIGEQVDYVIDLQKPRKGESWRRRAPRIELDDPDDKLGGAARRFEVPLAEETWAQFMEQQFQWRETLPTRERELELLLDEGRWPPQPKPRTQLRPESPVDIYFFLNYRGHNRFFHTRVSRTVTLQSLLLFATHVATVFLQMPANKRLEMHVYGDGSDAKFAGTFDSRALNSRAAAADTPPLELGHLDVGGGGGGATKSPAPTWRSVDIVLQLLPNPGGGLPY